jgi:hypothetical protein
MRMKDVLVAGTAVLAFGAAGCAETTPAAPATSVETPKDCSQLGAEIPNNSYSFKVERQTALFDTDGQLRSNELRDDGVAIAQNYAQQLAWGALKDVIFEVKGVAADQRVADMLSAAGAEMQISGTAVPLEATRGQIAPIEDPNLPYAIKVIPHKLVDPAAPCVPKFQLAHNIDA